jgi:hypothetical protein
MVKCVRLLISKIHLLHSLRVWFYIFPTRLEYVFTSSPLVSSVVLYRESNTVVAIKRIHRVFEDLIDCKRILREIAILNRLKNDNVIGILDLCVPKNLEKFNVQNYDC